MTPPKLNHGIKSFGHLLRTGECLSFEAFAERIADVYDIRNPQTNYIYRLLKYTDGRVEQTNGGITFNYKPDSLERAYQTVNQSNRRTAL